MDFVSLHTHTTYSYLDGYESPKAHVARVSELGMKALAFTEHGNVSSHVKLERQATAADIKPIFGMEAYCAPEKSMRKWHMTLLAMDQRGYNNLLKLTSRSWEDFYRWPTVHGDNLKEHSPGLIALSGCADSHLACTLLGGKGIERGDKRAALKLMQSYERMLGDRYYLEVQRFPGLERTCEINAQYSEWSERYGIPLAATADVHYPLPDQNDMQRALHSIGRGHTVEEADWEYDILLTYPLSDEEIHADLMKTGLSDVQAKEAILNTATIADRCNVTIPKMEQVKYPIEERDLIPWN